MRYWSQNLTEDLGRRRSAFWFGRASLAFGSRPRDIWWEWQFGKSVRDLSVKLNFGEGRSGAGVMFHVSLPFLFSVFLGVESLLRCRPCHTGFAVRNGGFWFYPLPWAMENNRKDPWYRQRYCFRFPWTLGWFSTEILSHDLKKVVWREDKKHKRDFLESHEEREAVKASVSRDYTYTYVRKDGEIQRRTATVHVSRMEFRARWWPVLPNRRIHTDIDVRFSGEVGEETGSWKGGCIRCGHEMLPGESPEECLRRMEAERKF